VLYLALVGSVALFMLVLYVLQRWSASATSYATLVMPLITVVAAALILGEAVGPLFVVGSAIALVGVYVGVAPGRGVLSRFPRLRPAESAVGAVAAAPGIEDGCRPPGC